MDLFAVLIIVGVVGTGAYCVGWVMGDNGAKRILNALEERHERASFWALKHARTPKPLRNSELIASAVNAETEAHSALRIAQRAYRKQKR